MEYIKILNKIRKSSDNNFYKGRHLLTKQLLVLKEIKPECLNQGIPPTAIREISMLKELQHPNIVRLENVFINSTDVVLSFEYVSMDLKTYIIRLPNDFEFPQAAIPSYMHQIVSGIAFCHKRRIFHRNLCPQNILITPKGVIKIADFDTARAFEMTNNKVYTRNVTILWYRSPEILLGTSQYTPKIDIWAIGCIFVELFLRKPPFQGDSEIQQIFKIVEVLGLPDIKSWPDLDELPYYFSGLRLNTENRLKSIVKGVRNIEIHLMKKMFTLNPVDRISAKQILNHPYFSNFNTNLRVPTIF